LDPALSNFLSRIRISVNFLLGAVDEVRGGHTRAKRRVWKVIKEIKSELDAPECEGLRANIRTLRERFEPEAVALEDEERARRAKAASRAYRGLGGDGSSPWLPRS
jgi:hypothetical protein